MNPLDRRNQRARPAPLRIMTYNVHRCVGADGRADPRRIAEVIAACGPDMVALQELDVGRLRTGGIDQAHAIAHLLGMSVHFNPALQVEEELYGDAILTALPMRLVKAGPLPGSVGFEARGAPAISADGRYVAQDRSSDIPENATGLNARMSAKRSPGGRFGGSLG